MCYGGQGLSVYLVFRLSYGLSGRTKKGSSEHLTFFEAHAQRRLFEPTTRRAAYLAECKNPRAVLSAYSLRPGAGVWVDRGLTLPDIEPAAPGAPIFGASFFQNFAFSVDNVGILCYNKIVHALTELSRDFTHIGLCVNIFYTFCKKESLSTLFALLFCAHSYSAFIF